MKSIYTILLLVGANIFMTFAWYGHIKMRDYKWFENLPVISIVLLSWGIALFEYFMQVPANRYGIKSGGGEFSLIELKVLQEVITLSVFTVFTLFFFKEESFRWNHIVGFFCLILAVYFIFKK